MSEWQPTLCPYCGVGCGLLVRVEDGAVSKVRLCMASAAAGYTRSLGSDGPPAAYADIELADCFLLIGTNTADCHPITFDTLVILMGVGGLPQIATRLVAAGRDPRTPAAVIHRGTTAAQQVVTGTLGDIARRAAGVGAPAVIVIGEVARCAQAVPADEELASPAPA